MKVFNNILRFSDYVFYRVGKAYFRWDKKDVTTAMTAVSFMQMMLICDLILIPILLVYGPPVTRPYATQIAYGAVGVLAVIMIANWIRYHNKYDHYAAMWVAEEESVSLRNGVLVVFAIATPLVLMIITTILVQQRPQA